MNYEARLRGVTMLSNFELANKMLINLPTGLSNFDYRLTVYTPRLEVSNKFWRSAVRDISAITGLYGGNKNLKHAFLSFGVLPDE